MGKNFSWRRVGKVVLAIVVLGALAAGLWLLISWRPVRIIWAAEARNRIENFLPCEDLPFYVQVEKGLGQHQDAVARLKQLGAQSVSVRQVDCRVEDGGYEFIKGEVVITYKTRAQRRAIARYLGRDFFGLAYSGQPVQ